MMNRFSYAPRPPVTPSRDADLPELDALTVEIIARLSEGLNTTDAAAACGISVSTLRRRLDVAKERWRVEYPIELVVAAVRAGLV